MTIPYQHGDFSLIRAIAGWRTYPLIEDGSPNAIVYNLRCRVNETDYTKPSLNATMASTVTAGVIALPWTNASAYFVGDFGHSNSDGGLVEFTRKFATKPSTSTDRLVGSSTFPFPARGNYVFKVPATAEDADEDENLYELVTSAANTKPAPLYETRTYWVEGVDTAPTVPSVFSPTLDGYPVDYVINSASKIWTNVAAQNGEPFSATVSLVATSPTRAAYETAIGSGTLRTVDVVIERYMGEIFVQREMKMKSQ
jgi:hypothetical protein